MHQSTTAVPERLTLLERIIGRIPLDYLPATVLLALATGSPVYYLAQFLDGVKTDVTLTVPWVATQVLFVFVPFYMFYMPRYLRLKVVATEPKIVPILVEGEEGFHRAFGRITATVPVLALAALFGTAVLPLTGIEPRLSFVSVFDVLATYLAALGFASYLWVYASSSVGLYNLGKAGIRLTSFLEDRLMGAQPVGALSLSLTAGYFGGLLLLTLLFSNAFLAQLPYQTLLISLLLIGIVMSFLPLTSIHRKMMEERARQQRRIAAEFLTDAKGDRAGEMATNPGTDLQRTMTELVKLKRLEMEERRAAGTPTWPFNIQLVGKLVTIILSVTAVLISRIITTAFRL